MSRNIFAAIPEIFDLSGNDYHEFVDGLSVKNLQQRKWKQIGERLFVAYDQVHSIPGESHEEALQRLAEDIPTPYVHKKKQRTFIPSSRQSGQRRG